MFLRLCEVCTKRPGVQRHHCFSQTKKAVAHYGRKLIDAPFNISYCCERCHSSHAKMPKRLLWDEWQFREAAEKAGYDLPEPMKSFKGGVSD